MGKEAKIGLAVIIVLVVCLGAVLGRRIMAPGEAKPQPQAATEEPSGHSAKPAVPSAQIPAAKPTVVAAKPASGHAKPSSLDLGQWNAAGERAKHGDGDDAAKRSPHSYMPKPKPPYQVDPNDRYAGAYAEDRAAQSTQAGTAKAGMAGAADAASDSLQPYDPLHPHGAGRYAPGTAVPDPPSNTLKVIAPPSRTGSTGVPSYSARGVAAANPSKYDQGPQAVDPFTRAPAGPRGYGEESRYNPSQPGYGYGAGGEAGSRVSSNGMPGYSRMPSSPGYQNYSGMGRLGVAGDPSYGLSRDPRRDDGTYEVQPNDNYWSISEKCYGTGAYFKALAEQNRKKIPQEDQLKVGDIIAAPDVAQLEKSFPKLCPKPSRREVVKRNATTVSTSAHLAGGKAYISQEGDTLYEIARSELGKASRWVEIYELNREQIGPDYDYLPAGLHLSLPGSQPADTLTRHPSSGAHYQR